MRPTSTGPTPPHAPKVFTIAIPTAADGPCNAHTSVEAMSCPRDCDAARAAAQKQVSYIHSLEPCIALCLFIAMQQSDAVKWKCQVFIRGCSRTKLTDRKVAGRPYTTPLDPQMTVAPSSDKKAAAGLWSKKKAIDISATDPSRKGTLECSRVSPAAIMPVFN